MINPPNLRELDLSAGINREANYGGLIALPKVLRLDLHAVSISDVTLHTLFHSGALTLEHLILDENLLKRSIDWAALPLPKNVDFTDRI